MEDTFLIGDLLLVTPGLLDAEQEREGVEDEFEPRHGVAAGGAGAGFTGSPG